MLVILEESAGSRRVYRKPGAVVSARTAGDVPAALGAIERALAGGRHAAGWFAYELGYALEPRLARHLPESGPLLRVGLFDEALGAAPAPQGRAYAGPLSREWDEAAYARRFRG